METTVTNLVAAGAAVIAAAGVLVAVAKERVLREKEIADRVRHATALVVAKLDRWKQISLQSFDHLQTAATEADVQFISTGDEIATRDAFWKQAVSSRATSAKCVLDEQIEVAYSNLFGYDPRIHALYTAAVSRLRQVDSLVFLELLNRTQDDILQVRSGRRGRPASSHLGNKLRHSLAQSRALLEDEMEQVLESFRAGMLQIVCASDNDLVKRRIAVPKPAILPDLASVHSKIQWQRLPANDSLSCKFMVDSPRDARKGDRTMDVWPLGVEFPEGIGAPPSEERQGMK